MNDDNDILKMFLLGYMSSGHTTTDESINWLNKQVEEFVKQWNHGLKLGFLPPLVVCLNKIKHVDSSGEYSSCFTITYDKHRYKRIVEDYVDEFKLSPV